MSELREFLNSHNMGISTLAKLIKIDRKVILRYEDNPNRCIDKNRRKIELALKMIRDENWMRPVLERRILVDDIEANYCAREAHLRCVLEFDRDFRERLRELYGDIFA